MNIKEFYDTNHSKNQQPTNLLDTKPPFVISCQNHNVNSAYLR